jgi:hypothetical protein
VAARKIFHRYFYGIAGNNFLFSPRLARLFKPDELAHCAGF